MLLPRLMGIGTFVALWYFWVIQDLSTTWGPTCVVMVEIGEDGMLDPSDDWPLDDNSTIDSFVPSEPSVYFCSSVRGAMPIWGSIIVSVLLPMVLFRPTTVAIVSHEEESINVRDERFWTLPSQSFLLKLQLLLFVPGLFVGLMLTDTGDFIITEAEFAILAAPGVIFKHYAFGFAVGSTIQKHWELSLTVFIMIVASFMPSKREFGVIPFLVFWGLYVANESRVSATQGDLSLLSRQSTLLVVLALNAISVVHELSSNTVRSYVASFFRFYTFFWVWPSLTKGGVAYEDLPPLNASEDPSRLAEMFLIEEPRVNTGLQLIKLCCYTIQRKTFWISILHGWFYLTCMTIDPLLLHALLSSPLEDLRRDLLLAIGLSVSMLLRVSCMEICFFYSVRTMAAARSALVVSIFEKSFEDEDYSEEDKQSEGEETEVKPSISQQRKREVNKVKSEKIDLPNLMSSDADKIGASGWVIFFLASWTFALVSLPVYLVILANYVGLAASFAGLSMLLVGGTFTKRVAGWAQPLFMRLQETRDKRSFFVRHAIGSMLAIKMFADETRWESLIKDARNQEMSTWLKVRYITAFNGAFMSLAMLAVPIVVFAWVTKVDHKTLDSADAFTTLLIISQITWSVGTLPDVFNLWSNLNPLAQRLLRFFKLHRKEFQDESSCGGNGKGQVVLFPVPTEPDDVKKEVVFIADDTVIGFEVPLFSLPDVRIRKGELVLVTGKVGTGKSCLLSVLAGVRRPLKGSIRLASKRAYVEQKPFLLNGTVRDNILFGAQVEDAAKLTSALSLARLDRDLLALPKGVDTLVGDGGVQLSGGQRARVSFARALYVSEATELFVLDDLLASVDADTGNAIWNDTILPLLDEGKKTVVISSSFPSQEMILRSTLRINLDRNESSGETITRVLYNDSPVSHRIENHHHTIEQQQVVVEADSIPPSHHVNDHPSDYQDSLVSLDELHRDLERTLDARVGRTIDAYLVNEISNEVIGQHDDDTRDASARTDVGGTVSWLDITEYWSRFGFDIRQRICGCVEWDSETAPPWIALSKWVLLGFILGSALMEILSPFWLAHWTETQQDGLLTYVLIQLGQVVLSQVSFVVLTFCAMGASRRIHNFALERLISAPMSVFDSIPAGRLLNIMSGDLRSIDEGLPDNGYNQLRRTVVAIFQMGIITVYARMVLLVLPFLIIVYRFILNHVRGPSRDVKRIEAASNAPVYTAFLDALKGKSTIKAFGKEKEFCAMQAAKAKRMATARVATEAIGKWAQALAVQTGCLLYFACGVVGVLTMYEDKDKDDGKRFTVSTLALLLTFAGILQRTGMDLTMGWTSFESSLVSIERMTSMMRLPEEEDVVKDKGIMETTEPTVETVPLQYPLSIEFKNVRLRYRLYRPLVLKGMTFFLPGGAKAAIVGRSGGGKSSLFQALLRIYPLCGGEILLGGVNIRRIPLQQLRNGQNNDVRVVLQDAILPQPTLRGNISDTCSDFELRSVLKRVGLQSPRFQSNLDLDVGPGGSLLSAGERQLVSLARAMVGSPKLLLCDECTSFVDEKVDEQVHRELLSLHGVTMLSILHRTVHLNKFDYIIEVSGGRIVRVDKQGNI